MKHRPEIIEDLYPELALVIISLNAAIITTRRGEKSLTLLEREFTLPFFFPTNAEVLQYLFCRDLLHINVDTLKTQSGVASSMMIPMIKKRKEKKMGG